MAKMLLGDARRLLQLEQAARHRLVAPRLPDLEFAIYEKARPETAATALAATLLALAQAPSRPTI
jgi:hypothetical protein